MRLATVALVSFWLAAAAAQAQAPPCDDIDQLNSVYFAFASAALTDEARERLVENLGIAQQCPRLGVLVDAYGDEDEAQVEGLSVLRAEAVASWYLARGLDAARVAARGAGRHPNSSAIEDPGPGDARARRADSVPMPADDLPTEAFGWASAPRAEPEPSEQRLADAVTLTLDWDLAEGQAVTLGLARLDAGVRTWRLPTDGLASVWPGGGLTEAVAAEASPGVVLVAGTLSSVQRPYPVTWVAGPDGARLVLGDVCAASAAYEAARGRDLRALAEAARQGDAHAVARATEAAVANSAEMTRLAAPAAEVGGATSALDCTPLLVTHDH